jgi:hypothetical protein
LLRRDWKRQTIDATKAKQQIATFVREDNPTTRRRALARFIGNPAVCSREKEGNALPWQRLYVSFIIDVHIPLYPSNEHFFDAIMFAKVKRGAYVINTARGKPVERDAVVRALKSAHVARYAGDVWPPSRRRRTIPGERCSSMVQISDTSFSAQARYAPGTLRFCELFRGTPSVRNKSPLTMTHRRGCQVL